jgi:tellurite resistance protein
MNEDANQQRLEMDPATFARIVAQENERLREAIRMAIELIDADGLIEAHEYLTSANEMCGADPFENGWDSTFREREYRNEIRRLRRQIELLEGYLRGALGVVEAMPVADTLEARAALGEDK